MRFTFSFLIGSDFMTANGGNKLCNLLFESRQSSFLFRQCFGVRPDKGYLLVSPARKRRPNQVEVFFRTRVQSPFQVLLAPFSTFFLDALLFFFEPVLILSN